MVPFGIFKPVSQVRSGNKFDNIFHYPEMLFFFSRCRRIVPTFSTPNIAIFMPGFHTRHHMLHRSDFKAELYKNGFL
jgi:hypothetical protein